MKVPMKPRLFFFSIVSELALSCFQIPVTPCHCAHRPTVSCFALHRFVSYLSVFIRLPSLILASRADFAVPILHGTRLVAAFFSRTRPIHSSLQVLILSTAGNVAQTSERVRLHLHIRYAPPRVCCQTLPLLHHLSYAVRETTRRTWGFSTCLCCSAR